MTDPGIQILDNSSTQLGTDPQLPSQQPLPPRTHSAPTDVEKDCNKGDHVDQYTGQKEYRIEEHPVTWHYLTFETELPTPSAPRTDDHIQQAPPCPNLNKYQSPYEWPQSRKKFISILSCISTVIAAYSAGSYAPGVGQMAHEWHISDVACLVGISIFTAGFAVGPMVLAPFSEINGRKPVFAVTGVLFVISQLCCGLTRSFGGMLASRFFVGIGGSTFSTMVGGIVSDIYHSKDRNAPMALFSGAALFGTGLGPIIGGYVAQYTTWRWIFYSQTIMDTVVVGAVILFFRETRGTVLLSWKAKALNKWYAAREEAGHWTMDMSLDPSNPQAKTPQRIRWKVKADEERASLLVSIRISCVRPFQLLMMESVVFWFSLWVSFSWAILYLTLEAVPLVYQTTFGFSLGQANTIFVATIVGAIVATAGSIYQDIWFDAWVARHKAASSSPKNTLLRFVLEHSETPEKRLFFPCVESLFLVVGLFMFGWTGSDAAVPWIFPAIALAFTTVGIFSIYLAVFNYLADAYQMYASSALAAQSFCRNLMGSAFPLVTTQMYTGMGVGPASSLLGCIGLALTVVPWVLVLFGPKIRARSKFATALEKGA